MKQKAEINNKLFLFNLLKISKDDVIKTLSPFGKISKCSFLNCACAVVTFSHEKDAKRALLAAVNNEIKIRDQIIGAKLFVSSKKHDKKKENEQKNVYSLSINNLDDDSLIKIFRYLSMQQRLIVEEVCRRWEALAKKAWYNIQELRMTSRFVIKMFGCSINEVDASFFQNVIKRCGRYLDSLMIGPVCSSSVLPVIRNHCHKLKTIDLEFNKNSIEHFVRAFFYMKELKKFKIKNVKSLCARDCLISLPDKIEIIHMEAPNNRTIPFSSRILAGGLLSVFSKFNSLVSLTIRGFRLTGDLMVGISQRKGLVKLDLAGSIIDSGIHLLSDLKNLEEVNLHGVWSADNYLLSRLSKECEKLKDLDVSSCGKITDESVKEIIRNCLDLENLNVSGTSVTKETVSFAINETKCRVNKVVLQINPGPYKKNYFATDVVTPYLIIRYEFF